MCFIRPFKKYKGQTPDSSSHPSRPSFDEDAAALETAIQEAPRDHSTAKRHALIRDGYRCLITGRYDRAAEKKLDITPEELVAYGGLIATQCAHIIPIPASTHFDVNITRKPTPANIANPASGPIHVGLSMLGENTTTFKALSDN
ncbi:hypothetical protein PTI98_011204 [Pleurotus ostreatus]|nr:hypothetical protein PTI98_011204 [Pleurotus ostreatus]